MDTSFSGAKVAVFHEQNDSFCLGLLETVILVQKSLICIQKPHMRAGTHRD